MNPQPQQLTVGTSKPRGWVTFVPSSKVLLAARLVAEGTAEGTEIAEQVGITPTALSSWRRKPAFMDVVNAHRDRIGKEVMDSVRKLLAEGKKRHNQRLRKLLNGRQR